MAPSRYSALDHVTSASPCWLLSKSHTCMSWKLVVMAATNFFSAYRWRKGGREEGRKGEREVGRKGGREEGR